MTLIHQPHDKFFRQSLKEHSIALDFLKAHIPKELYVRLDLTTLHAIDKSYLTPELKALHSDVVYSCQIDGKLGYIPILFLIEHQSTADAQMAFRLLQYTIHLMDDHLKAGHTTLPLVLPLCMYHGETSPYPYSTDLYECFEDSEFAKKLVFKPFHLIDLTTIPIKTLKQHGVAALMEIAFQKRFQHTWAHRLKQLAKEGVLQYAIEHTTSSYLRSVLYYILSQGDEPASSSVDELLHVFLESLPGKQEVIMTFAEQLEQRGLEKGLHQGLHQGLYQGKLEGEHQKALSIAKNMLNQGSNLKFIQLVTGLADEDIEDLK